MKSIIRFYSLQNENNEYVTSSTAEEKALGFAKSMTRFYHYKIGIVNVLCVSDGRIFSVLRRA